MQDTRKLNEWKEEIFAISTPEKFTSLAIALFREHYYNNPVYKKYVSILYPNLKVEDVKHESQIPFLPIEFFKTHKVLLEGYEAKNYFASSGTTGTVSSKHWIVDMDLYEKSCINAYSRFFGDPAQYTFLALLPNYLEQPHSSLIHMVKTLMNCGKSKYHGFYLDEYDLLLETIRRVEADKAPTLLIGVSYALLDLAEKGKLDFELNYVKIMETGGMKGRRKEMIRAELHQKIKGPFAVEHIYSEYGMCELFSQAYLREDGLFQCPPWMKILLRSTQNPLEIESKMETGGINVIDLANIYSCPFIATQDLGKIREDGCFEVLGRFDGSDVRGCNLMVV